jgi:hypothetical protein
MKSGVDSGVAGWLLVLLLELALLSGLHRPPLVPHAPPAPDVGV